MELQHEFYLHITIGEASKAASLMARIALNLSHDAKAYPVDLSELSFISRMPRRAETCGFNELLVADYVRSALMHGLRPWKAYQVEELTRVAEFNRD